MTLEKGMLTVDADGHVLEPRDTWEKHSNPSSAVATTPDYWIEDR